MTKQKLEARQEIQDKQYRRRGLKTFSGGYWMVEEPEASSSSDLSSKGLRPANPSSMPCQYSIRFSPSFQHRYTSRPSRSVGKSTRPASRSFTMHPVSWM